MVIYVSICEPADSSKCIQCGKYIEVLASIREEDGFDANSFFRTNAFSQITVVTWKSIIRILISETTTGRDRSFGCPIICTEAIHNTFWFIDTSTILAKTRLIAAIGTSYLAITASNDTLPRVPVPCGWQGNQVG